MKVIDYMDISSVDINNMEMYSHGKMNFMVGLCEKLRLPEVFNSNLEKHLGRRPDIPYGIMAEMMLVNICDDHHPLLRLQEYYEMKDLEGIFHYPIELAQINDDRFGKFLDAFYEAGPRRIFGELSTQAFLTYGIEVKNINYDTTSKVMWGTYETEDGKEGVINIDFGHSKQKREDKKQIKMAIGVANGVIVDAKVLSGNKDDKTYNQENLDEVGDVLKRLNISESDFYYIADCALFSKENFEKAKKLKLITRMPETTKLAKECIRETLDSKETMTKLELKNAKGEAVRYLIAEKTCAYEGINLKCAICYSVGLEDTKKKTIQKQVKKEKESIEKLFKTYNKRVFACMEDAEKEITKLTAKDLKKIKYHDIEIFIETKEKKKPGRQPKDPGKTEKIIEYYLRTKVAENEKNIAKQFEEACSFVLCSNDLGITAENLLREYKTQSSVEKKFQQIKSPHFVNALYLDTPERIEALTYLILISMMILSAAEHVVRREMKAKEEKILGPGKVKMSQPTLWAILEVFNVGIGVKVYFLNGKRHRCLARPLKENHKKLLQCLNIEESVFCWNG